jgi:hypothetical protein
MVCGAAADPLNDKDALVTHPLTSELHAARALYAGATRLACAAWALLLELHDKRVWLAQHETVRTAADDIYHDAEYDAQERYGSVDEFAQELLEEMSKRFEVERTAGEPAFKVMPFFSEDGRHLRSLGLSSLSAAKLSDFRGLDVAPFEIPVAQDLVGVSDMELRELVAMYRRKTLKLLHLMRNLRTAMHYVEGTLSERGSARRTYEQALAADDVTALIAALIAACEMPFEPAPSRYFGTEATRINTLRDLDHEAGRAFLLDAAGR